MALSVGMGICAILLSLWYRRQPISVAWSTPGGALLASSAMPEGGFQAAVGAFLLSGALTVIAGLWRPLGRAVAAIPSSLANAMLAGVLLNLCLAPMHAVAIMPSFALPHHPCLGCGLALPATLRRARRQSASMVVLLALHGPTGNTVEWLAKPIAVMPVWSTPAMIGLAVPLFLVTMASQNIPGMAVLAVNGYTPPAGPLFQVTGLFTLVTAPFGGQSINLAAITAALCAGPDAHPDPAKRYWAAVTAGATYVVFGLLAGAATSLIAVSPPILIESIAGLALLGALGSALMGAVNQADGREAALITFLVTASGLSFFGVSGAFWGLLAGGAMRALTHWRPSNRADQSGSKSHRDDIQFARLFSAGGRFGMADTGVIALQRVQHRPLRPALEHFRHERSVRRQNVACERRRQFRECHDPHMVGRRMPGRVRGHVGQHEVGFAAEGQRQPLRHIRIVEIAQDQRRAGDRIDRQQINAHHRARATPDRDLSPAARRCTEIKNPGVAVEKLEPVIQFQQLERRPRPPTLLLRRGDVGVVQLPPQPFGGRRTALLGGFNVHRQFAPGWGRTTLGHRPKLMSGLAGPVGVPAWRDRHGSCAATFLPAGHGRRQRHRVPATLTRSPRKSHSRA